MAPPTERNRLDQSLLRDGSDIGSRSQPGSVVKGPLQPAFYRYVRHLPPRMVVGKARQVFTVRFRLHRAAQSKPPQDHNWHSTFNDARLAAFASIYRVHGDRFTTTCDRLHHGEFVSNGVSYDFGSPEEMQWTSAALPGPQYARWHHDFAFFSFAMPLVSQDPHRGMETIASMVRALDRQLDDDPTELRRFHWSPIATASRLLALSSALALAAPFLKEHEAALATIGSHVWRAAEVLKLTVERYLGFNHAATTQSGMVVAWLVQHETDAAYHEIERVLQVFERSTLSDGMWAERSPAYHLYMLVLVTAVTAMLRKDSSTCDRFVELGERMRTAAATVLHPDGEIAIFNDAAIADAPAPSSIDCLPPDSPACSVLPTAGYARLSQAGTVVIMDAGPMGPDAVIGHGHADFLSIEVSVGRKRLIVDPGVASGSSGADRNWTRSAASHNGPTLDGCEPAEFFGAWRVGRRGTARFTDYSTSGSPTPFVRGECTGYSPWGVTVKRRISLDTTGALVVEDQWEGRPTSGASVAFLIPSQWEVKQESTWLDLRHQDGTAVRLRVIDGDLAEIGPARTYPWGPMHPDSATRLLVKPYGSLLTTVIGTGI